MCIRDSPYSMMISLISPPPGIIGRTFSSCLLYTSHSAIQEASTADFDWDSIFEGVDWFHFTGITPALGPNVVDICREACKAAKAHGVKISCDLNYRGKLWTREEALSLIHI